MADDISILRAGHQIEMDLRRIPKFRHFEAYQVGASKDDIERLLKAELIYIEAKAYRLTKYKLTDKGRGVIARSMAEGAAKKVKFEDLMDAFSLIVGFDDIKTTIASALSAEPRRRVNFLLEGPPACAKSLILEGVRSVIPDVLIAFGSRTSAAGLSDKLFETQPSIQLLDELEKMPNDCWEVLLGVMETGELIEVKSRKSRGVKLDCITIGACNSSAKFPREFLSRVALHIHFKKYTRDEFVEVCEGFLSRSGGCPEEVARMIGARVYDESLGDVRKARGVWDLMGPPTQDEVNRVIDFMLKYGEGEAPQKNRKPQPASMRMF